MCLFEDEISSRNGGEHLSAAMYEHSFKAYLYTVCAYSELEAQGADRTKRQA